MEYLNILCKKAKENSFCKRKALSVVNSEPNTELKQNRNDNIQESRSSPQNRVSISLQSSKKTCINGCNERNKSELILLTCKTCYICKICLFNLIGNYNKSKKFTKTLECECELTLSINLIRNYIPEEILLKYLENLTKIKTISSNSFICGKCSSKNQVQKGNSYNLCQNCDNLNCLKCLESHDDLVNCKEHYLNEFKYCEVCNNDKIFAFDCNCLICKKCQLKCVIEQLEDDPLKSSICLRCKKALTLFDQQQLFGRKEILVKFKEDSLLAPRFECMICYKSVIIDRGITLNCLDRFCMPCISAYSVQALYSLPNHSTAILCPYCKKEIGFHILNNLFQGKDLTFYIKKLMVNIPNKRNSEYLKFCNNCSYGGYISIDTKIFDCPVCNKSMCARCNKAKSESCCSNLLKSSLGLDSNSFASCPSCKAKIIKEGGCNFIKCLNPECIQVSFCNICLKILRVSFI